MKKSISNSQETNGALMTGAQENHQLDKLQQNAYSAYQSTYRKWERYDKQIGMSCLSQDNRYTFADDMVSYLSDYSSTAANEIDSYIKRMLKRFCKHNKQAYYELIISTMLMANLFNEWGYEKESQVCSDWYYDLFFNEQTYSQYITEQEISDFYRLR